MEPLPIWLLRDYDPPRRWHNTWLYRLYSADRTLLYVGVTRIYPWDRVIKHLRQPWGGQVWGFRLELFEQEWQALAAEVDAIKTERPLHNIRSAVAA